MRALILFCFSLTLQAGQSLIISSSGNTDYPEPNNPNGVFRQEWYVDTCTMPSGSFSFADSYGTLTHWSWNNGAIQVQGYNQPNPLKIYPLSGCSKGLIVRFQANYTAFVVNGFAANTTALEVWPYDGNQNQYTQTTQVATGWLANTGPNTFNWYSNWTATLAYMRELTSLVPLNSKPPTTYSYDQPGYVNTFAEWKLDRNLNDSSGNQVPATGTTPTYTETINQTAIPVPKTIGAPFWSAWISQRAGTFAQLDSTSSYSLCDTVNTVSPFWQITQFPIGFQPLISSNTATQPTLTNTVFGQYVAQLRASDSCGNISLASLTFGSVATDSNFIVIQANPKVKTFLGDQIAFGHNPWGMADYEHMVAYQSQTAYQAQFWTPLLQWTTLGSGTVAFSYGGIGNNTDTGHSGTTLNGGITATTTSITVTDATQLPGLGSLPAIIKIGSNSMATELVRICSVAGNVLTVCYDGRGINGWPTTFVPASVWSNGALVGEYHVTGTGTKFVTDSVRPIGSFSPGPPGPVVYSTGTVTVSGSTVTGTGTTWVQATGNTPRWTWIIIHATHSSVPVDIPRLISSIGSTTSITTASAVPLDLDPASFTYSITSLRYAVLGWQPNGTNQVMYEEPEWIESDTSMAVVGIHDSFFGNGLPQSGGTISYSDQAGHDCSQIDVYCGVQFYGTSLMSRSLYQRSGITGALTQANYLDETWPISPGVQGGYYTQIGLNFAGGAIAAYLDLVSNPNTSLDWTKLSGFQEGYYTSGLNTCYGFDTRDQGSWFMSTAIAAYFGTGSWQTLAQSLMPGLLTHENGCANSNGGFANSMLFNYYLTNSGLIGGITLTNGSATATTSNAFNPPGTGESCSIVSTGSITVTNGSASVTGTGFTSQYGILINGTIGGNPYSGFFFWTYASATTGTLSGTWPGDSGTFTYSLLDSNMPTGVVSFGTGPTDTNDLSEAWNCQYVNSTTITLNRPWDGFNGSSYYIFANAGGYYQQSYMLGGYGSLLLNFSALQPGSTGTGFQTLLTNAGTYLKNFGFDAANKSALYWSDYGYVPSRSVSAGVSGASTILSNYPSPPDKSFTTPTMPYWVNGPGNGGVIGARSLNAEMGFGLLQLYKSNPTTPNKTFVDTLYGALWGYAPYVTGGVYSDSLAPNEGDFYGNGMNQGTCGGSIASYKCPGFYFGTGGFFDEGWPAVRLGGVAPSNPRTVYVTCSAIPSSGTCTVNVTLPTGVTTAYPSSTPVVAVTVDDTMGNTGLSGAQGQILYYNSSSKLVGTGSVFQLF